MHVGGCDRLLLAMTVKVLKEKKPNIVACSEGSQSRPAFFGEHLVVVRCRCSVRQPLPSRSGKTS